VPSWLVEHDAEVVAPVSVIDHDVAEVVDATSPPR
jgi:hypothetical protein